MGKNQDPGSGINIPDPQNWFFVKILKLFDVDPGSGMGKIRISEPGWEKFGSGINTPDPQHCIIYVDLAQNCR
jgi:hypothetical protein